MFYDKLTFIYLTLPHFQKTLDELVTEQDKWFYVFKHLQELQAIPPILHEAIFLKLFEAAQIACFNPAERQAYQDSLKYYRDLKNVMYTAAQEGREEGREKGREEGISIGVELGKQQSVLALYNNGFDATFIAKNLNLSLVTVEAVIASKSGG